VPAAVGAVVSSNESTKFVKLDSASGALGVARRNSFNDLSNPAAGGTVDMLLNGTEGKK
jgi:hypothetical protein